MVRLGKRVPKNQNQFDTYVLQSRQLDTQLAVVTTLHCWAQTEALLWAFGPWPLARGLLLLQSFQFATSQRILSFVCFDFKLQTEGFAFIVNKTSRAKKLVKS